jgi:hypothetical protein
MAQDGVSPMDARIDLMAPRIKEGGVTIWYGRTAYRNCHVQAASADGKTVTLSTTTGVIQVEWLKVPADAKAKLFAEYSKAVGEQQNALRRARESEDRANGIVAEAKASRKGVADRKSQPPLNPSQDKNELEEKNLRDLYRRKIEALRKEFDALGASTTFGDGSPANWRTARKQTIFAEIQELEAKIRALNGPEYKLRSMVINSNTDK